jgi:DNA-binding transcriptional regulator LsrR (DeoR family)
LPRIPGVIVVPATGGMQQPAPHFQINEFVRLAAEQLGGEPRFIHAPYLVSRAARMAFLNDPSISDQTALWDRIEVAIVGVGMPHAIDPIHAAAATASERAMRDVAGDVIRHYFNFEGKILSWNGGENLFAVSVEQLRATPLVVGVAIGPEKARAIAGAARAKVINALVTNVATAQAILELI